MWKVVLQDILYDSVDNARLFGDLSNKFCRDGRNRRSTGFRYESRFDFGGGDHFWRDGSAA